MKIALVGIALPPVMGGLEVHIFELAKQLQRQGHEVHIFGVKKYRSKINKEYELIDGIHIHRAIGTVSFGKYEFYELAEFVNGINICLKNFSESFDIIHGHCVYPSGIACRFVKLITGINYVITSHGNEIMEFGRNKTYAALRKYFTRNIFKNAAKIIGVSEELKLLSILFGGDKERTVRFSNVVDTKRFFPTIDKAFSRKNLNIAQNVPVVLSLRRLSRKNGVHYLIQAAVRILQQNSSVLFLICGDGEKKEALFKLVKELHIEENFIFTGNVPNDKIYEYIISSDIAVFPSLAEATSIACLEVMACGIPVVASDVGGLPEIIQHGETGMLVKFHLAASTFEDPGLDVSIIDDLAQTIFSLLANDDLRLKIGQQAASYVRNNHTWDIYGEKIEDLYKHAIQFHD